MKPKIVIIFFAMALLLQALCVHAYQHQEVISAGGGADAVDGKISPNFGVIGEPIVSAPSISGVFTSSIGFIYQTLETAEPPPPPPPASIYAAMDMDINTSGDLEPDTLISANAKEAWAAIALQSDVKFSGFELELSFDSLKLEFVPEAETEFQYEDHPFNGAPNFLKLNNGETTGLEIIDDGNGVLQIRNYIIGKDCASVAVDGAGFLAYLQFRHLIDDVEIPLVLENVNLTDCAGGRLSVDDTSDGIFVIQAFQPHFKIGGYVKDKDGNLISGVLIELEGVEEIASNDKGFYLFEELEEGTYTVIIDTTDYDFDPSWVTVTMDDDHQNEVVNFSEKTDDLPNEIPGDLNGDGYVDTGDIGFIMEYIGRPLEECPQCDIYKDGEITAKDMAKFKVDFL